MNVLIASNDSATIFVEGKPYVVGNAHPNYDTILTAAREKRWSDIPPLVDLVSVINNAIEATSIPGMRIENNRVVYKHITFPDDISEYVINIARARGNLNPIVKFMDKLVSNPDHRIFQQLFGFLSYGKNPITDSGNFLAYKKVRNDYKSCHDWVTDNSIGTVVQMDRASCNSNPEETCSAGLHFCSREYLGSFSGDRIIVLEINPADVVSIPVDYNNTKGRACKYVVIGELNDDQMKTVEKTDVLAKATVDETFSKSNSAMYELGFKHGASKKGKAHPDDAEYVAGHDAGRASKKNTPAKVESTDATMYELGFKHSKNKKAQAHKENDSYMNGYRAGRASRGKVDVVSARFEQSRVNNVTRRVQLVVSKQLGWAIDVVEQTDSFAALSADSFDLVELCLALEEEFDQEIPDADAEQITTVSGAIKYILENWK